MKKQTEPTLQYLGRFTLNDVDGEEVHYLKDFGPIPLKLDLCNKYFLPANDKYNYGELHNYYAANSFEIHVYTHEYIFHSIFNKNQLSISITDKKLNVLNDEYTDQDYRNYANQLINVYDDVKYLRRKPVSVKYDKSTINNEMVTKCNIIFKKNIKPTIHSLLYLAVKLHGYGK